MNSKEALKELTLMINREKRINSEWNKKIYDLELIIKQDLDKLENLEKENQELKNTLLSLELDTCIPELRKENQELRNIIKILKDKIELPLENDFDVVNKDDIHLYRLRTKCLINEEEYELLKEVLINEY